MLTFTGSNREEFTVPASVIGLYFLLGDVLKNSPNAVEEMCNRVARVTTKDWAG
jgi:hypothetical protein